MFTRVPWFGQAGSQRSSTTLFNNSQRGTSPCAKFTTPSPPPSFCTLPVLIHHVIYWLHGHTQFVYGWVDVHMCIYTHVFPFNTYTNCHPGAWRVRSCCRGLTSVFVVMTKSSLVQVNYRLLSTAIRFSIFDTSSIIYQSPPQQRSTTIVDSFFH